LAWLEKRSLQRHKRVIEKEQVYWELSSYLSQEGCPICALIRHELVRFLDGLMYESVNDRGLRQHLRESGGFCAPHSRLLYCMGGVLGQSIILRDVIGTMSQRMDQLPRHKGKATPFRDRVFGLKRKCPACELEESVEEKSLEGLLESLVVEGFARRFRESDGLCLPHFSKAWTLCGDSKLRQELAVCQQRSMERMQRKLDEVIRKYDFRYQNERMDEEAGSWLRAARMVCGYFED